MPQVRMNPRFYLTPPRAITAPEGIAVVGIGRWGKIMTNVLALFSPPIARIYLVAESNYSEVVSWVAERRRETMSGHNHRNPYHRILVKQHLNEILDDEEVKAVFVTNKTSSHAEVARQLLLHGKHAFVEKPLTLHLHEAKDLVQLAEEKGLVLVVGHEYMMARHLYYFRELVEQHLSDVHDLHLYWKDCSHIQRWGGVKNPDWSNNIITDLFPHVLSQLFVLFGVREVSSFRLRATDGSRQAQIEMLYGSTPVVLSLDKSTEESYRAIHINGKDGSRMVLDHTQEPGSIYFNDQLLPPDPIFHSFPRPLACEAAYFFDQIQEPDKTLPLLGKNSLSIVEATEMANTQLIKEQTEILRKSLLQNEPSPMPTGVGRVLRYHLLSPLLKQGLIKNPKDEFSLEKWVSHAFRIVYHFSRTPWITQQEILQQTGVSKEDLRQLNAAIRDSDFLQVVMTKRGVGQKYWETVIPMTASGAIQAALAGVFRFPFRVGFYPGLSCMFYCTFCGRNAEASYQRDVLESGIEIMKGVVAGAPSGNENTFSISGGLEPLTNPKLGELIECAKRYGFNPLLITNGFLLTSKHINRLSGFWALDKLRVSLYGVDEPSYQKVIRREGAFKKIKQNVIDFLKLRNELKPSLRFGLNFIILPGGAHQLLRVLDVIEEINASVHNGRGVDFLTLREDFGVPVSQGLSSEERTQLTGSLREFETRRKNPHLAHLEVDFGYALFALREGIAGEPLVMVTHQQMCPKAYPQASVVIDLLGDVFLYREAGFLDRPGNDRYKIGRITKERSLEDILHEFVENRREIEPQAGDPKFMDAFDHIVTVTLNQAESDAKIGIPFNDGPIRARLFEENQ